MRWMLAAAAAAFAVSAPAANAESAFEMVFRSGTLDAFEAGDRLSYAAAATTPTSGTNVASTVSVEMRPEGRAAIEEHLDAGDTRVLGQFDAEVGNPLAMFFLERTIRTIAEGTGGSEFYLRNRIKDALREPEAMRQVEVDHDGRRVAATEVVLAPFAGDAHLDRLGVFGDLRIRVIIGENIPGWYYAFESEAGGGAYRSGLTLAEVAE